jgi:Protein tyrosine and serine/threonine kinase
MILRSRVVILKFYVMCSRWAFGILLWEVFSLGSSPYPTLVLPQMFDYMVMSLRQGMRMAKPRNAPHAMLVLTDFNRVSA